MMKWYLLPWWMTFLWGMATLVFLFYLVLPNPPYPEILPSSLQSDERGDTEEFKNRRAYFTDMIRSDVLAYYENQWQTIQWNGREIPIPVYRINHPPERAFQAIKDQTRSTFLEEIVHPMRESFFVNGFLPSQAKDAIIIKNQEFLQKISVRYVRVDRNIKGLIGAATAIMLLLVINEWWRTLRISTNGKKN